MKIWKQTKRYVCSQCAELVLHDSMHKHVSYLCHFRPSAIKKRLLAQGKVYEPKASR